MAYQVENIEQSIDKLQENGIKTTSKSIIFVPITGLRQIFISNGYTGHFIELIEWSDEGTYQTFTTHNMNLLAKTMSDYI